MTESDPLSGAWAVRWHIACWRPRPSDRIRNSSLKSPHQCPPPPGTRSRWRELERTARVPFPRLCGRTETRLVTAWDLDTRRPPHRPAANTDVEKSRNAASLLLPQSDPRRLAIFDWRVNDSGIAVGDPGNQEEGLRLRVDGIREVIASGQEALRRLVLDVKTPHIVGYLVADAGGDGVMLHDKGRW